MRKAPIFVASTRSSTEPVPVIKPPKLVRSPHAAAHLPPCANRDFFSLVQTYASREEGNDVRAVERREPGSEVEDVRALEEERPLLGEEEREPRQVGPARVDLGLGEVRVHRQDRCGVGPDPLERVQAGLGAGLGATVGADPFHVADQGRTHGKANALVEPGQLRDEAGPVGLGQEGVSPGTGPAAHLQAALDAPLHVESPGVEGSVEGEALDGDPDLRGPTFGRHHGGRLPHGVPAGVLSETLIRHQGVVASASRIDGEHVAGLTVQVRIENDLDVVLGAELTVPGLRVAHDSGRIVVEGPDAHVEVAGVGHDPDLGGRVGLLSLHRLDGGQPIERRCSGPRGLVENPVHPHVFLRCGYGRAGALLGLQPGLCREACRECDEEDPKRSSRRREASGPVDRTQGSRDLIGSLAQADTIGGLSTPRDGSHVQLQSSRRHSTVKAVEDASSPPGQGSDCSPGARPGPISGANRSRGVFARAVELRLRGRSGRGEARRRRTGPSR